MIFSLVTPSKKFVADAEVEEVFIPAFAGELNVLEGHAPLMATLETGVLRYRLKGDTSSQYVALSWGYLEISRDRITILAETAETATAIDMERAKAAKAKAESELARGDLEQHEFRKYQLKLQRATLRMNMRDEPASTAAEKRGEK
jgi:F-type H+-transporting ATPase subunit epsilon